MHRFYTETPITAPGQRVALSPEESAHAARVLRLRPGDAVCLLDGAGIWSARLVSVAETCTEAEALEALPSPEPLCRALLYQGLPKADKMEWIIQKATELGVSAVIPVEMERCVAKADHSGKDEKKRERLSRIAMEAAKQSGRAAVPEVSAAVRFDEMLRRLPEHSLALVAWEEEHSLPFSAAVREYAAEKGMPETVAILIGPEGGISAAEYEKLKAAGARAVTLGPRILRTETAGLCALSVLWTALGEM